MQMVFEAFEEDDEGDYLEDGFLSREGFAAFWEHLKNNSSLWRLLRSNIIIYLICVSFCGTLLLLTAGFISAIEHHWHYVHVMKLIGYICHLAFEIIVMKMEIRHWRGHIEASRTIIHDYSRSLKESCAADFLLASDGSFKDEINGYQPSDESSASLHSGFKDDVFSQ